MQLPNPTPGFYYVTATNGAHTVALVSGPYKGHARALADVERCRKLALKIDPWSHFWSWGTARWTGVGTPMPPGKLQQYGYLEAPTDAALPAEKHQLQEA